jgi:hypothetical protein
MIQDDHLMCILNLWLSYSSPRSLLQLLGEPGFLPAGLTHFASSSDKIPKTFFSKGHCWLRTLEDATTK